MQLPPALLSPSAASFTSSLSGLPHAFLQPTLPLHSGAVTLAKHFLDPLASAVSREQAQRQQNMRKKRKRGTGDDGDVRVLQLKKIHIDGFSMHQVWEQAKRVLNAACVEIEQEFADTQGLSQETGKSRALKRESRSAEVSVPQETKDSSALEGNEESERFKGALAETLADVETEDVDLDEHMHISDEEADGLSADQESGSEKAAETFVADAHGLNDGFFSIDDFNKQSDFLEQQDARGTVDSEDEDIDWDVDPSMLASMAQGDGAAESEEEEEEDGPTFGNVDLNAPEGDSEDDAPLADGELDGVGDMTNADNIMYADFFAPPARKADKGKKKRERSNARSAATVQGSTTVPKEDDVAQTMSKVHRDLFEDSDADSDEMLTDLDPADPKARRSTHERRQAKIAEEIRRLEAANVAKREWQMSGEARAADRPINSLLEEDLEFERAGKPVPVITAEVSQDIEALIKRRILAGEFDEVQKRRLDDLVTGAGAGARRGRVELEDTKSSKGLAEMYEEEHLRKTDPSFEDALDAKTRKEHAEIEQMWKKVCGKLDSLSSWHYKPKPAAPALEVRAEAPAIEMEDARPTAGGDVAGASTLAPQEVYQPGKEKRGDEIVTRAGMPVARDEMTREDKVRRRRRAKERIKKAARNEAARKTEGASKKTLERKQMVGDLKRAGVGVIGKKGQITDVEGRQQGRDKARAGVGSWKL